MQPKLFYKRKSFPHLDAAYFHLQLSIANGSQNMGLQTWWANIYILKHTMAKPTNNYC